MNGWGYTIAAYTVAGSLYAGYLLALLRRRRQLDRRVR